MTQSLEREFLGFLTGAARNCWLKSPYGEIYVRKSSRLIDGVVTPMMDIANIEIFAPHQRKGVFRDFLNFVEQHNPRGGVYVELVGPKFLADALQRRGYRPLHDPYALRLNGTGLYDVNAPTPPPAQFLSYYKLQDSSYQARAG